MRFLLDPYEMLLGPAQDLLMRNDSRSLGLNAPITRRDFIGATLVGSGAMLIRQRYGRIAFGHSELSGRQSWGRAAQESRRALKQVLEVIA